VVKSNTFSCPQIDKGFFLTIPNPLKQLPEKI
jgi:hypothetical protein